MVKNNSVWTFLGWVGIKKNVLRDNQSQNIWGYPSFSCEVVHYRDSFIISASINKIFFLAKGIGLRLSFHEV